MYFVAEVLFHGIDTSIIGETINKRRSSAAIFSVDGGKKGLSNEMAENFKKSRHPVVGSTTIRTKDEFGPKTRFGPKTNSDQILKFGPNYFAN